MNRNIMMTTLKAMIPIMILLAAACSREDEGSSSASTTPGRATIVIDSGSSTKAAATSANVDTTALVNSIRIYAFNSSGEKVGYYHKDGLTSESSPYACVMELTEGGDLDFYVLVNDAYALVESEGDKTTASDELNESSTITEIKGLSLTGLSVDGEAYVPMANIQNGTTADENNFTYDIVDTDKSIDKIIYIDVTRAMARLSMFFAKTTGTGTVTIDKAVIYNGPENSPLYPTASDDGDEAAYTVTADNFGSTPGSTYFLGSATDTDPIEVTKTNDIASGTAGRLSTSNLQLITSSAAPYGEAYLLPNPYGSSDPDNFVSIIGTADTVDTENNPTYAYYVDLTYTINGTQKTKPIYLPVVTANDWIKIKGIFDYNTVEVEFAVTILSWDEHEMSITFD